MSINKVKKEEEANVVESVCYIVYHGRAGAQGIFRSWKDTEKHMGAKGVVFQYGHCVFKRFSTHELALMYYTEVQESGVLNLLKMNPHLMSSSSLPRVFSPGYTQRGESNIYAIYAMLTALQTWPYD